MIAIKVTGGLGNQMFQYAYGRALALEKGDELTLDTSWYGAVAKRPRTLTTRLRSLGAHLHLCPTPYIEQLRTFDLGIFNIHANVSTTPIPHALEGHWQSEDFFKKYTDTIRSDFARTQPLSPAATQFATSMQASGVTVALHVRRGDYVTNSRTHAWHGVCSPAYYTQALDYIIARVAAPTEPARPLHVFVFSDDIAWCKENINIPSTVQATYVEPTMFAHDHESMHLMGLATHTIIANSTFSWWAAWLNANPTKIVIAPAQWFAHQSTDTSNITPSSWIRL